MLNKKPAIFVNLNWFYKSPPNLSQKKVIHTYEFKYILGKKRHNIYEFKKKPTIFFTPILIIFMD